MNETFKHFDPFDEMQMINFHKILEITKAGSFFEYFNMGFSNAELHVYFDFPNHSQRIVYTLYFDQRALKISRCTGWDGKKYTVGGGNLYKVADVNKKGRAEFDEYMKEFCLNKWGYESTNHLSSIKY
jgi:hypothetical protein